MNLHIICAILSCLYILSYCSIFHYANSNPRQTREKNMIGYPSNRLNGLNNWYQGLITLHRTNCQESKVLKKSKPMEFKDRLSYDI